MGLPVKRHTSSKRKRRRSHLALSSSNFIQCSKCKEYTLPHIVCANCGYYGGTQIIDVLAKLDKKERRRKEKELAVQSKNKKPLTPEELTK